MKYKIRLKNLNKTVLADKGQNLLDLLRDNDIFPSSYCNGTGRCHKCIAIVNGDKVLSCQYKISDDIEVFVEEQGKVVSFDSIKLAKSYLGEDLHIAIDLGTTTISYALLEEGSEFPLFTKTINNPQAKYGADIISRIQYSEKGGFRRLHELLIDCLNKEFKEIHSLYKKTIKRAVFAGNTTMLHLLLGVDPSSLGQYPYTPLFLDFKTLSASDINLLNCDKVELLPSVNAFIGADITSGLSILPTTSKETRYNLLIDLGTNAELVIYNNREYLATSSAAGPCFEGGHISAGMSAVKGAIYRYSQVSGKIECKVITQDKNDNATKVYEDIIPVGICGTGFIDIIASMYDSGVIDKTGLLKSGKSYTVMNSIRVTQEDIRQFQLAKSAIRSAIEILMEEVIIDERSIETVFLSGGISSKISVESAIKSTLLPVSFLDKIYSIPNSSLLGLINYINKACYLNPRNKIHFIDLAINDKFRSKFVKNINFA